MNNHNCFIHQLKASLLLPLPGKDTQLLMAPRGRRPENHGMPERQASVLLLLYPEKESTRIVFIKRNDYDGIHSGQVSFPGGRVEETDENFAATALRETNEEIGIAMNEIEIIGRLSPLHIPVSNYLVNPFVGYMNQKPEFQPNPGEVKYIITADLKIFQDPTILVNEEWDLFGELVKVPFYHVSNHKVWGATAMILSEFLQIMVRSEQH